MKRILMTAGAAAALIAGSALAAPSAFADGYPTLANGFSAKVVAQSWQTISGNIDATGYDLGIYIGPGVHNVRVIGATVTGANDEGILVQDAHDVLIKNSTVSGNTTHPAPDLSDTSQPLQELKGISLTGTHNVVVTGNTVTGNGDGGIGIYDDGPNSSHTNAPIAIDEYNAVPSFGNVVSGNLVKDNLGGCGIVVSAKNPGGGVRDNLIAHNTVLGFDLAGDMTPAVGGIVVAGGSFGAVSVDRNTVVGNTITGGFIPGISLHASAPGRVTRTLLLANKMARNGSGAGQQSTGVELATQSPGAIDATQVLGDSVTDDYFGVFHVGDTNTRIEGLRTSGVTVPVAP